MTAHEAGPGFTLADRLGHPAPMRPVEVASVGSQLAVALDGWHRAGRSHLALAPALVKVHVGPDHRLVARLLAASGPAPAAYQAPEQRTGRPVGPAADVFSLGVVLLECLLGRRDATPVVPEDLGAAWRYLLGGMIASSPVDRPTADTVARTLAAVPGVAPAAPAPAAPHAPAAPRSKLLPAGQHVEATPVELPRENRLARLRPQLPGRRRPPEPDVRRTP